MHPAILSVMASAPLYIWMISNPLQPKKRINYLRRVHFLLQSVPVRIRGNCGGRGQDLFFGIYLLRGWFVSFLGPAF